MARPGAPRRGVYPNLFCAHPPFQIDGNFGFTAGVAELLLQSHAVTDGCARSTCCRRSRTPDRPGRCAACARGALTVDLAWSDHTLASARLVADQDVTVLVRHGAAQERVDLRAGQVWSFTR